MPWYGYALISAFAIAIVGVLQKKTLEREHSLEYVTIFGSAKLLLFIIFFGGVTPWGVTGLQLFWLGLGGVLMGLAFLMVAKSMRRTALSTVMPILATEPAIVAVLAFAFIGERLSLENVFGIGLVLGGSYLLELRRHTTKKHHPIVPFREVAKTQGGKYVLWGLFFFAVSSVIGRYILLAVDVLTYVGYALIFSTILYIVLWAFSSEKIELLKSHHRWLFPLIVLIAAIHLTSNLAQAKAMSLAAVGLVIAIKRTSAVMDVVFGGKLFHEQHLMQKTFASIIILAGVYYIVQS